MGKMSTHLAESTEKLGDEKWEIMNSGHTFPCASQIFAYNWKAEKYPGRLGMHPDLLSDWSDAKSG